jgi:hypothetical protein
MPASVVHGKRDEHKWQTAKEAAKQQGRGGDYAYIMGIYKRMKPSGLGKSDGFGMRTGQTPTPQALAALRAVVGRDPFIMSPQSLPGVAPRLSIASITRDIGMDASTQYVWQNYIADIMTDVSDEISLQNALLDKMRMENMDPYLGKAMIQRARQYWRFLQMRKSAVDARRNGSEMFKSCYNAVKAYMGVAGDYGIPYDGLDPYEQAFGDDTLGDVLDVMVGTGAITFDGARFYQTTPAFGAEL